jgi:iron complex transport system permease protein
VKYLALAAAGLATLAAALLLGPANVPLGDILGSPILWQLRLPRAVLGFLVGGALGVSGVALQALVRNPLADPFLLGLSGGAGLGAVAAIALHLPGPWALPLAAFAGAVGAMTLVYRLGLMGAGGGAGELDPRVLLLGGVAVGAFAAAITTALVSLAEATELRNAFLWLWGGFSGASWTTVLVMLVYAPLPLVAIAAAARPLDLLSLGEEPAQYLGADVRRLKRVVYLAASLLTAAAVAMAGVIGFVGLVVPHLCRLVWGRLHRTLIPTAFLTGGILVAAADTLARTVVAPRELPVGIVTALLGVPVFALLLRRWTAS